jgi:hypothetical protein
MIGLGLCATLMLGLGMYGVLGDAGATGLRELAGFLGVVQFVALARLREHSQSARMFAMVLAWVQAVGGLAAVIGSEPLGALAILLAGSVVVPLSARSAEEYYGVVRT